MKNKWSEEEKQFLIENYSNNGVDFCVKKLQRSKSSVCYKAHELNQYINIDVKSNNISNTRKLNNYSNYDVDKIIDISDKYVAYFLGYFWADGNLIKRHTYQSSINLIEDDAVFLYSIMSKFTNAWTIGKVIKKTWTDEDGNIKIAKNQRRIRTSSQKLYNFFYENDFNLKSKVNFNKIWQKIPNNLKKYFILGLFDGDGTFNNQIRNNKYYTGEFIITGIYKYDWSILEEYFKLNNIHYKIYNLNVKLGKVSRFVVRRKLSLITLYNILYDGDFYGLKRKYIKYLNYYEKIKK